MPMKFRCTACTARLHVPTRWAGSTVECPKCSTRVVVPSQPSEGAGNPFESRHLEKRIASLHALPSDPDDDETPSPPQGLAPPASDGGPGGRITVARAMSVAAVAAACGLALGFVAGALWRGTP